MEVDPGIQPVEDERLLCLECGRWYRQLPPHLRAAHDLSGAEYRERHQLATKIPLRAPALQRHASRQGTERYANRPDIRQHLEDGRAAYDPGEQLAGVHRTANYEGVRAVRRIGGAAHHDKALAELDARARVLGFADFTAFLTGRAGAAYWLVAAEIGMGRTPLRRWYKRLGIART